MDHNEKACRRHITSIGGQAVIEGVMMRGPGYTATAVREPSGSIVVNKEATTSISDRFPILKKPFLIKVINIQDIMLMLEIQFIIQF